MIHRIHELLNLINTAVLTFEVGLAFTWWGADANHGRLYARTPPDMGCVFAVDLLRFAVPAGAGSH